MQETKIEIKEGITLHKIKTQNFKTNLYAVFVAMPLKKETVTSNALIGAVLRRGTNNLPSQELISKKLEEMYGASFDCGIEKAGDNQILKFYLETLNEEFLPEKENLDKKCMDILFDIAFNPLVEQEKASLKTEYVEGEKKNLKQIIESKIDNKAKYSYDRCIEEMFKNNAYGLYKFGYIEDLERITPESLYTAYQNLINNCKIDIFCSGNIEESKVEQIVKENENIQKLKQRTPEYVQDTNNDTSMQNDKENIVEESMQVTQGKLVIGMNILELENNEKENKKYIASVYNAILGGGANSKLFQNVREKQSLAYTASSGYVKTKNTIFIRCGIEIENYKKAVDTIKIQLKDMQEGNFTNEDIESAKKLILSSVKSIPAEQDNEIAYYYAQELSDTFVSLEDYSKKIENVTKEQIVNLANKVQINTIYFLKD